jgi:outer membrane protein assembly factor BamB
MQRFLFFSVALSMVPAFGTAHADARWPYWRGADHTGVVADANPPTEWSESKNIKWKTKLPGEGKSTPIIWGDKIILQAAVAEEGKTKRPASVSTNGAPPTQPVSGAYKYVVFCVDRATGDILWQRAVHQSKPHQGHHPTASFASYSPVTDGERIWASFGSRGLYCLDMDGNEIWRAATLELDISGKFGEGSSPALVGDAVVVLADHEGQSKLFAFNKDTGDVLWEVDREEGSSWSSPVPVKVGDRWEVLTSASAYIRSYDAKTGELIWKCSGLTGCAAPTPIVHDGKAYFTTGFRGESIMAITLGNTGDLTGTDAVAWAVDSTGSNVPSPLIHDGRLYVFKGYSNKLTCFDAATGEVKFLEAKLDGLRETYASPLAVGDRIYITGRNGTTLVLKPGDTLNIVASNTLDEVIDASPVVIGDELYLRGSGTLYCVARNAS